MKHTRDKDVVRHCTETLRNGPIQEAYALLPHLSVCKENRILPVVLELLFSGDREREEFAACAIAALCDSSCLESLLRKLEDGTIYSGPGSQRLQMAVLEAIGELGEDSASDSLLALFHRRIPRDNFRRKRLIVVQDALGAIAMQGGVRALEILTGFLSHEDYLVRANSITNISNAFWHRPNEMPQELFDALLAMFKDHNLYVQHSLISALENLADVGCQMAADIFAS